jgi:hypothetical protein
LTTPSTDQARPTAEKLWEMTLGQLQLQMTRATFDTWLRDTWLVSADDGLWQVGVKNDAAREWLENRLHDAVSRTVTNIAGHPVAVEYVVNGHKPDFSSNERREHLLALAHAEILQFDVYEAGYINHAHYIQRFWGALIGAEAMQVWSYIRSFFKEPRYIYSRSEKAWLPNPNWTPWTPALTFRPSDLARAIESKDEKTPNRRKVTGGWVTCKKFQQAYDDGEVWDSCRQCGSQLRKTELTQAKPSSKYPQGRPTCRYWQPGVFDKFKAEGLALINQTGNPIKPRTVFYEIQIYQLLPLLSPAQVEGLNKVTRQEHTQWLREHSINLKAWHELEAEASLLPLTVSWAGATIEPPAD